MFRKGEDSDAIYMLQEGFLKMSVDDLPLDGGAAKDRDLNLRQDSSPSNSKHTTLSLERKSRHVIGNKSTRWRLFSAGCILGEKDVCLGSERTYSVSAMTNSRMLRFSQEQLNR